MQESCYQFQVKGSPVSFERYGNGHINETYLMKTDAGEPYILQKINHRVFKDVPQLMSNIGSVTRHLAQKESDPRRVLTLVPTLNDDDFWASPDGSFWRAYIFVKDSLCLERAESPEDFRQSAVGFGQFQNMLSDFPSASLHETIKDFHHTPKRYDALLEAIRKDAVGRVREAQPEIDFALKRQASAALMTDMQAKGELPLRVTHNDTKLNNVMLDDQTREALCVIDLDTVMPGLAGNDFGDSIRFGASTAAEDEKDLSKVSMSLPLFRAYANGFLGACDDQLVDAEIETLPQGARLMTLECGVRFLTDFLSGDTYFRVHRPEHNLDRCRTQFKLVQDMEDKMDAMHRIIKEERP